MFAEWNLFIIYNVNYLTTDLFFFFGNFSYLV